MTEVDIKEQLRTFAENRVCTSGFDNETLESLADKTVKDAGEGVIGFIHENGKTACYNKSDLFRYWLAKVNAFRGYVQTPEGQPPEPVEGYFYNFPLPPLIDTFIDEEDVEMILMSDKYLFRLHQTQYRYYDTNSTLLIGAYHNRHRGGDPYVTVTEVQFYTQKEGLAISAEEIDEAFQRAHQREAQEMAEEEERLLLERTFLREGETLAQALRRLSRTEDLSQVTQLDLTDMNIEVLPSEIVPLTPNLERLIVSNNNLTTLPVDMPDWENLYRVIAGHNQISIVPVTMGSMPKLNIVDFTFNRIQSLPPSFYNLKLRYLYIEGNPLTEETQEKLLEWMVRQTGTDDPLDVDIFTPEYLRSREEKELETKEELEPPTVRRRLFEPESGPEEEELKVYDVVWYTHRLAGIPEAGVDIVFQTGRYWADIISWGENIQHGRVYLVDEKYYIPQLQNQGGYIYRGDGVYESSIQAGELIRFGVEDTGEELIAEFNVDQIVWWTNPIVSSGYSQEVIYQEGEAFYGEVIWRSDPQRGTVEWNDQKQGIQINGDSSVVYRWNPEEQMYQSGNRRLRLGSLQPIVLSNIYWMTNQVEPTSLPDMYMYQYGEYVDNDILWFLPAKLGRVLWNEAERGVYIEGDDTVYRHRAGTQGLYFGPDNTLLRLGLRYPS